MRARCLWTKIGKSYHAGSGPRGRWKITKRGDRWVSYHKGVRGGWKHYTSSRSLGLAKQGVAFHLNCKA